MLSSRISLVLLALAIPGCAALSPRDSSRTTVSDELVTFLKDAEYVLVCKKRGMKLYVAETLKGSQRPGSVFATFSSTDRIDPSEIWTDLIIYLPRAGRVAYFRVSSNGVIDWFDARNANSRWILLNDLRLYYRTPKPGDGANACPSLGRVSYDQQTFTSIGARFRQASLILFSLDVWN
jgi:hypothetical protein